MNDIAVFVIAGRGGDIVALTSANTILYGQVTSDHMLEVKKTLFKSSFVSSKFLRHLRWFHKMGRFCPDVQPLVVSSVLPSTVDFRFLLIISFTPLPPFLISELIVSKLTIR